MFIITSLTSMALPRLPANASKFQKVELQWYRWEAIVTFLMHIVCLASIPLLSDYNALRVHKCDRIKIEEIFVVTGYGGIICFGILYVLLMELYLRMWPIVLTREISDKPQTNMI